MRLVLGLSLTATSAVWVLVDTVNGKILADEVVALDSVQEIARAAARSVQAFDVQTEHDIEGVRLTWSDDARQHGIRLRTKLRLFGFETVETVTPDAAREGRNKTARHLAPHLALAYGAARSDINADESRNVFQRLAAHVPARVAAAGGAAAVVGIGMFALLSPSPSETPAVTAAEVAAPQSAPAPAVVPIPATPSAVPAPRAAEPVAAPAAVPVQAESPEQITAWQPDTNAVQPQTVAVPEVITEIQLDSTVPETIPVSVEVPHLSAAAPSIAVPALPAAPQPVASPAQPVVVPAQPMAVAPRNVPPSPLPPVLSTLFSALP
ncbi:MAG: hypothetical protein U1C73_03915 [Dietzia sp.]|nr:hypothetical protein [Dietzia sp.]